MRLLLTHGFFLNEDAKEQKVMKPYPPLGILYLSSYLRHKGFAVDIYDSTFGSREELFRILEQGPPAWLGIYGNLLTRQNVLAIANHAHECGWRVVLGGPEPANYAEEYLTAGADYVVAGEGELVLEELLSGNPSPRGVAYREDAGAIVRTPPSDQIPALDALPWPDRERIDLSLYLESWRKRHGAGSISLITARGCPYHCRWCSHSTFGKTHRRRSVGEVVAETQWILKRYQPEMLWYADDVFTIHPGWTLAYAAELKRRSIRVPFECITRADRFSEPVADALAEMGCFRVWIGAESGSQRILDSMERGVKLEQVEHAIERAKRRGIQTGMFLMWGYEGEDLSDIEATVEFVGHCKPDTYLTTVSYPIKGTPYFDQVRDKLIPLKPWKESTGRDVGIRGRHSRRYYNHADQLLRCSLEQPPDSVRIAQARAGLRESFAEVEA